MTKLSEVSKGDVLIADNCFTCLSAGEHVVHRGFGFTCRSAGEHVVPRGLGFYICCSEGRHYLYGQVDSEGNLVGLKKK